jgi:hypothetical protein
MDQIQYFHLLLLLEVEADAVRVGLEQARREVQAVAVEVTLVTQVEPEIPQVSLLRKVTTVVPLHLLHVMVVVVEREELEETDLEAHGRQETEEQEVLGLMEQPMLVVAAGDVTKVERVLAAQEAVEMELTTRQLAGQEEQIQAVVLAAVEARME